MSASTRPTRRISLIGASAALVTVLALSACSTPGSGGGGGGDTAAPTDASTDVGEEDVELVLYDGAGLKTIDDALIAAFTEQYPNITITTRFDPDDVQAQNAPRVLAAQDAPDIARVVALGDIVSSGLLTNLDPWAEQYGWTDLPEGQLAMYRVDDEGVRGSGSQYTVASGFVTTGLYVNTDVMADLGIDEAPTTIDELETALETAKTAGVTPILAGNQTGQGVTMLQFLLNNYLGSESVNSWVFNAPDATIDTPEGVEAVQTVADWVEAGYFNADANGTDNAGAMARFVAGESLFYPSGNWDASNIGGQMDNVAFVSPPALEEGELLAMSDPVSNFGIPANSENKDAAAAFLNFLVSDEARAILVENGFAPSGSGEAPATEAGSLNESVQAAFASLVEADGQVQFVQNATNGITQTWNAESQNLFGGRTTPAEFVTSVQTSYEDELGR